MKTKPKALVSSETSCLMMMLYLKGKSYVWIGKRTGFSQHTVKTHVTKRMQMFYAQKRCYFGNKNEAYYQDEEESIRVNYLNYTPEELKGEELRIYKKLTNE